MNKNLIAMAMAAAVAAPMAANADVTAYARLQAEIASMDNGTVSGVELIDNSQSFFGMKGSEELGNGTSMFAAFEVKLDTATGSTSSGSRMSFVGMKAGFGSVMLGSVKSPYKYSAGVNYDNFVATTLESRGTTTSGGFKGHGGFLDNMIAADLMDGKFKVAYGIDENDNATAAGTAGDVVLSYTHSMGGKDELVFAYYGQGDVGDYTATKVGGKFGAVKFSVEATDTGTKADTFVFVAYDMAMGDGTLTIQGGNESGDTYAVDGVTDITVGFNKKFTKTARWFAGARSTTGDKENTVVTYGMRLDF